MKIIFKNPILPALLKDLEKNAYLGVAGETFTFRDKYLRNACFMSAGAAHVALFTIHFSEQCFVYAWQKNKLFLRAVKIQRPSD